MSADRPPLHVKGMLRALDAHGVDYVVIGGVAGRAHGDPTLTYDLDITLDRYRVAADRLTDLQVRRQPGKQRERDAREEARPALNPEPPADTVR